MLSVAEASRVLPLIFFSTIELLPHARCFGKLSMTFYFSLTIINSIPTTSVANPPLQIAAQAPLQHHYGRAANLYRLNGLAGTADAYLY